MPDGESPGGSAAEAVTLVWRGEVDLDTVHGLREELMGTLRTRPRLVLIDLGEVGFIDSAGLGVLVAGWKYAREHDIGLAVRNPRGQVRGVLEQMGLMELLVMQPED